MSAPDWQTVKRLLADALERPAEERARFLDEACGADIELRREVASLLPDADSRFLEEPATALLDVPALAAGVTIGRYTLGPMLGEGGMGRVYEATQEQPRRSVALKVLRPGFLAAGAERRFAWEAEALARLDHPAIAKVYEAGTLEVGGLALPWFALEKIDGRPLLEAADALGLGRRARLELFLRIADGIDHAHRRGVIHRDLKPDNVLVDADGAPHVLDFGIARATDPLASVVTTAGEVLGTLAYMAPEQIAGGDVDVRVDVFALGGMLYRLLTGKAPHALDGLSLPEVAVHLASTDAVPAGRVDSTLVGDLETILATALEREPARRYGSVERLAGDVRRFLADELITARPPTALYQLTKFTRRHRGLVGGLVLSLGLLVAGVIGTSVGLVRSERSLARAELERDRARETNRLLQSVFASADPAEHGSDVRVVDLLDAAGRELAANDVIAPGVRATLHLTLGRTYERLGRFEQGEEHLLLAIALFEATEERPSESAIDARAVLADLLFSRGEWKRAEQLADEVRAAADAFVDPPPWIVARPLELELARHDVHGDSEAYLEAATRLHEHWRAAGAEHADAYETATNNLGVALLDRGELARAERLLREAVDSRATRLGGDHPNVLTSRANLATCLTDLGRAGAALSILDEVAPKLRAAFGATHPTTLRAFGNRATALGALGEVEAAQSIYRELLAATEARFGVDHAETWIVRNNLGVGAAQLERFEEAEQYFRDLLASFERADDGVDPIFRTRAELNLVSALDGQDRRAEAEPLSRRGLSALEEALGEAAMPTVIARNNHALLLAELGRTDEALEHARRNLESATAKYPEHPMLVFPIESNLARCERAAGDEAGCVARLTRIEAVLEAAGREADLARVRELLGR
ncbi:MAG: serine/threonine-protein kinase [Planctomycetota bacterium]